MSARHRHRADDRLVNSDPIQALCWFAVRCIFKVADEPSARSPLTNGVGAPVYEERITLWRAASAEAAIRLAETDAVRYTKEVGSGSVQWLGLSQSYLLNESPDEGVQIFSLARTSDLSAESYLDAFFDTGSELSFTVED